VGLGLALPIVLSVGVPSASAACASRTTRSISGTVSGQDDHDVNVSIGFDVESTSGKVINVSDGCAKTGGYSAPVQELNHYLSGEGAPRGSRMYDANGAYKGVTTRSFRLTNLPSNAAYVWIEVYSRRYTGSPCTTCMGPADVHKYGYAMRRRIPVGTTGINIKTPMTCSNVWGGAAGKIAGVVKDRSGKTVNPTHVYTWSEITNSPALTGWGSAQPVTNGNYLLSSLASKQRYTVHVFTGSVDHPKYHVPVYPCQTTHVNFVV
jgi:hypothetical protein